MREESERHDKFKWKITVEANNKIICHIPMSEVQERYLRDFHLIFGGDPAEWGTIVKISDEERPVRWAQTVLTLNFASVAVEDFRNSIVQAIKDAIEIQFRDSMTKATKELDDLKFNTPTGGTTRFLSNWKASLDTVRYAEQVLRTRRTKLGGMGHPTDVSTIRILVALRQIQPPATQQQVADFLKVNLDSIKNWRRKAGYKSWPQARDALLSRGEKGGTDFHLTDEPKND